MVNKLKDNLESKKMDLPLIRANFGIIKGNEFNSLVDSGSSRSLVSRNVIERLQSSQFLNIQENQVCCITANSSKLDISHSVKLKIKIENFSWKFNFLISDVLSIPVILGADFIKHSQLIVNIFDNLFWFNFKPDYKFNLVNFKNYPLTIANLETKVKKFEFNEQKFSDNERKQLINLIEEYPDVLTTRLGKSTLGEYNIRLADNTPVKRAPYQLSPPKMQIMRNKIDSLLKEGVIEPSNSCYSSPSFLVDKPNGDHRLVIDYRALNKKIEIDCNPIPNIHFSFHWFAKAKYFTVIDLNQGYYQMSLGKESRHLTSFCTMWGLYQWTRVPFGLATGAQAISNLMEMIFSDLKYKYVFCYLDDLVVYSENFEQHIEHVNEVFKRLRKSGLTINPSKLKLAEKQIPFLGHLVSSQGVSIDPDRTKSIREYPPPKDSKGIARFIGAIGYYSKFIPNYAEIAAPLNALRKKDSKFVWSTQCEKAFQKLKDSIMQPPVLRLADFDKKFIVQSDASSIAIAAVLSQEVDGILQPVAYASRKLTQSEQKYSTYELEGLAVVFAFEKFRLYLLHKKFLLQTDNSALSWILGHTKQLGRIARWILKIQEFQFDVEHIRGTQNLIADTLSRMYQTEKQLSVETIPDVSNVLLSDFPLVFQEFHTYQQQDPILKNIIERLKAKEEIFPYSLSKGVLMCKVRRSPDNKIVVPQILKPLIFKYFHDTCLGGHLGIFKTIQKVQEKFTWNGINKDIANMVKSCLLCAQSKPAQKKNFGFLSSKVADRPLQKFFLDFVGPLTRTERGNTMIFSCIDAFSKYCWLIPIREGNSNSVIREMKRIFVNFSIPESIVTDNGSAFVSKKFKNFCFQLGIKHFTTIEYYPQANLVERIHRNLKSALIAFNNERQTKWDLSLEWLPLAFNLAVHESNGFTPYELLFRHQPRNSLDNIWNIESFLPSKFSEDTQSLWRKAKQNLLKAHQRSKSTYDKTRTEVPFKINDLVMLQHHPKSKKVDKKSAKLMIRWKGPYAICDWLSPVTVSLKEPGETVAKCRAHVSQLKMWKRSTDIT
jgi:hypothetical protein